MDGYSPQRYAADRRVAQIFSDHQDKLLSLPASFLAEHEASVAAIMQNAVRREGHVGKFPSGAKVEKPEAKKKRLFDLLSHDFQTIAVLTRRSNLSEKYVTKTLNEFDADGLAARRVVRGHVGKPYAEYRRAEQ